MSTVREVTLEEFERIAAECQARAYPIRLMKHYVTNGTVKARVHYSHGKLNNDSRDCVTLYAKDYTGELGQIFAAEYQNDTEIMTDYFDKGRVRIFSDNPLFAVALQRSVR